MSQRRSRPKAPDGMPIKPKLEWHNRRGVPSVRVANMFVSYLVATGDWGEESHAQVRRYARERLPWAKPTPAQLDTYGPSAHFLRGTFNTATQGGR